MGTPAIGTTNVRYETFSTVDFTLDVSAGVPVDEKCVTSGTLFVPNDLDDRPTVVVAVPGASLNRKYFDLQPPGGTNFSQARYFAERGIIFAATDYLGGGDSSRPIDGEALTLPVLAAAAHEVVVGLKEALRSGALVSRKIEDFRLIGAGFSFGAAMTIVQQGTYEDFDAIVVKGYSCLESAAVRDVPESWEGLSVEEKRAVVVKGLTERFGGDFPLYHGIPREGAWRLLYPDNVSDQLVAYDDEVLHTTLPRTAGVDVMTPGFARPYAARIKVPAFLAFGDADQCTQRHLEPTAYPSCPDVTLTIHDNMRHLHNFAESRTSLWERVVSWIDYLSIDRDR